MTAQINDIFIYQDRSCSLIGISGGELFDPGVLGLKPRAVSTDCWRGYQSVYALADSRLIVDSLLVNLFQGESGFQRQQGPSINGISPNGGNTLDFNNCYENLNYGIVYTGGLLIADEFIPDLYVHMGYQAPWKYKKVIELILQNGILAAVHDRSERMGEIRKKYLESSSERNRRRLPINQSIQEFIERSFDRRYET
jgi:hypothetical protein